MSMQFRSRPRSSPAVRLAVLVGLALAVRHFMAPAYSMGGSWEGSFSDAKNLPTGLDQVSVDGLHFSGDGLNLSVADGHLTADWASGPMSVSANDDHEWQFNFTTEDGSLVSSGTGVDKLHWEASKQHTTEGFGEVDVRMTSGKDLTVKVTPDLPEVAGMQLAGHATSDGDGLSARLKALKTLDGVDFEYSVENAAGDYGLLNLNHNARIDALLGANHATLEVGYDGDAPTYNATLAGDLELAGATLRPILGVDTDGVYGHLTASRSLGEGLSVENEYAARMRLDSNASDLEYAVSSTTHADGLGHVKLSLANGEPFEAAAHLAHGPASVDTTVTYDLDSKDSTYNASLTGDLRDLAAGQLGGAEVQVGMDSDGIYASVAASRDLGLNDLVAEYSTSGRLDALEHALKVSNHWGHAKLVKSGDADPRLQLGYELEV